MPDRTPVALEPPETVELTGDGLAWTIAPLTGLAAELGVTVTTGATRPGVEGFYRHRDSLIILSDQLASANAKASTLVHELGHVLVARDRRDEDPELDYAREELVVESVVFWRDSSGCGLVAGRSVGDGCHRCCPGVFATPEADRRAAGHVERRRRAGSAGRVFRDH